MFDVIWTDHDRELQGEHRAKKEAAKEKTSKKQKRASLSTKRSSVSSGDSPFSSFFRGHGLKRINTSDARSTNSSSRLASPSTLATSFDGRSPRSSDAGARPAGGGAAPGKCSSEQGRGNASAEDERSVDLSRHGSIFSKYPESDNVTSNSTGDISFMEQKRVQGKPTAPIPDTQPHYENATWPRSSKKMYAPEHFVPIISTHMILGFVLLLRLCLLPSSPDLCHQHDPSARQLDLSTWILGRHQTFGAHLLTAQTRIFNRPSKSSQACWQNALLEQSKLSMWKDGKKSYMPGPICSSMLCFNL